MIIITITFFSLWIATPQKIGFSKVKSSNVVFKSVGAGFYEHVLVSFSKIIFWVLLEGANFNLVSSVHFWSYRSALKPAPNLLKFLLLFV